jgi:integrase
MASIYRRERSPHWWVKFRDHQGNVARVSSNTEDEATARELAEDMQEAARLARNGKGALREGGLRRLIELGYLETDTPLQPTPRREEDPLRLEALALAHPAVQAEREKRPHDHTAHMNRLREFCEATGVQTIRELTSASLRGWLSKLDREGMTSAQIKHRLTYIRAAVAVASELGHANPIATVRLPRESTQPRPPETLTMAQLAQTLWTPPGGKEGQLPPRIRAAVGLMGLMGLGLSEACRLEWGDLLPGGILHVGARTAKNQYRNRHLPVPTTLLEWLLELKASRDADPTPWRSPLMLTHRRGTLGGEMDWRNLGRAVERSLHRFSGSDTVTAKSLRKSFATIAVWELNVPPEIVEAFMGRRVSALGPMTSRHYLGKATADRLRPWSDAIDARLRAHSQK